MQRTITQYKSLHDLPICLHRSCNDFHYARENSTEAAYSTSNPNYEATSLALDYRPSLCSMA